VPVRDAYFHREILLSAIARERDYSAMSLLGWMQRMIGGGQRARPSTRWRPPTFLAAKKRRTL